MAEVCAAYLLSSFLVLRWRNQWAAIARFTTQVTDLVEWACGSSEAKAGPQEEPFLPLVLSRILVLRECCRKWFLLLFREVITTVCLVLDYGVFLTWKVANMSNKRKQVWKEKLNAIKIATHFVKQKSGTALAAKVCFGSLLNVSNTDVLPLAYEDWVFTHNALSVMKLGSLTN